MRWENVDLEIVQGTTLEETFRFYNGKEEIDLTEYIVRGAVRSKEGTVTPLVIDIDADYTNRVTISLDAVSTEKLRPDIYIWDLSLETANGVKWVAFRGKLKVFPSASLSR